MGTAFYVLQPSQPLEVMAAQQCYSGGRILLEENRDQEQVSDRDGIKGWRKISRDDLGI
jgi:hypothetical protein